MAYTVSKTAIGNDGHLTVTVNDGSTDTDIDCGNVFTASTSSDGFIANLVLQVKNSESDSGSGDDSGDGGQ